MATVAARSFALCLLMAAWVAASPAPVYAQSTGIAVERFAPAPGPNSFGQIEGAFVPAPAQLYFTGAILVAGNLLTLRNALSGSDVAVPVRDRVTLDLGGEIGLWRRRLSIGLGVPVSLWQMGDRLQQTGVSSNQSPATDPGLASTGIGDIRLRAKALLTAPPESPEHAFGLAALLEVTVPGGGQSDFIATSSATVAPRLLASFRYRFLAGAVNLGVRFMPERFLYQTDLHHALEWGAAFGGILPVRRFGLSLFAETFGYLNFQSPSYEHGLEVRGAIRFGWWRGSVDLGGGAGFGSLAPTWRGSLVFRMFFGEASKTTCTTRPVTL